MQEDAPRHDLHTDAVTQKVHVGDWVNWREENKSLAGLICAKLPPLAPSLSCRGACLGEALQGRCLPPVSGHRRDRLESQRDRPAPAQPSPSWVSRRLRNPRTVVRGSGEALSLGTNRARPQGRWQQVRLSPRREGMLGSLLAPRFPFLSLLV